METPSAASTYYPTPVSPALSSSASSSAPGTKMLKSNEYLSEGEMDARAHELTAHGFEPEDIAKQPKPEVTLRWKRFLALVLLSVGLIAGVSAAFLNGIPIDSVNEAVGTSDKSEDKVDLYNTISGVIMGVVETFISLGLANFFPVFTVYVHNLKWFPGDDPSVRTSKVKKVGVMLFFPLLMVAFGNSFTALQASASTEGADQLLTGVNLAANITTSSAISKALPSQIKQLEDTILKTVVQRRSSPFTYRQASQCSKLLSNATILQRLSQIDSTSLLVGFPVKEWSRELYPEAPLTIDTQDLGLETSFELLFQGQAMMERSFGDVNPRYTCATGTDGNLSCTYDGTTYMNVLQEYINGSLEQTSEAFEAAVFNGIGQVFGSDLNRSSLAISSQSFPLSSNIELEALSIRVEFSRSHLYSGYTYNVTEGCTGEDCDLRYLFTYSNTYCGADSCAFLDWGNTVRPLPRDQALMTRYMKSCASANVDFSLEVGAGVPQDCTYEPNAAFAYGFGSRIVGDEFGMEYFSDDLQATYPYAINPRRELSFSFARIKWEFEKLDDKFHAECKADKDQNCTGLSHNMTSSGRYILLGADELPSRFRESDLTRPVMLYQLNAPVIQLDTEWSAVLNRINASDFTVFNTAQKLSGSNCSVIAESYMSQVEDNHYWVKDPLQPMYTSALMYLYQQAAVTSLFQENVDEFGKMALSGDRVLSNIYLSNTVVGAVALWTGCGIILLLVVVALVFPNERARLQPPRGQNPRAERFIAVQTEEIYPNLVYKKRFLVGDEIKFREFSIESVTLHHKMEEEEQVRL